MIDPPPRRAAPLQRQETIEDRGLTQPYTALAIAVMQQALADAYANLTTSNPDSTQPTPAAVADARAWLSSPHAAQLADLLELHPQTPCRYVNAHPPGVTQPSPDRLTVAESAVHMRMHPEHVRKLIRTGHLRATKAADGWGWRVDANSIQAYLYRK